MGGMAQPDIVPKHSYPRGRHEAHLRAKLPSLFGSVGEFFSQGQVEEDHRFADMDAILGATEGEDIDTRLPGDLSGCHPQSGHGIGKACPIHVEA